MQRNRRANSIGNGSKKLTSEGKLVPDEIVIEMIDVAIENNLHVNGFLFDGFPRTTAQAEALDKLLAQKGTEIAIVLALQVTQVELIQRLLNRGRTSDRIDDVNVKIVTLPQGSLNMKKRQQPLLNIIKNLAKWNT